MRRAQTLCSGEADNGEDRSVKPQRGVESMCGKRSRDRKGRYDRAHSIAGCDRAGSKAAPIRKPAHHQSDDADIDDAGAKTTQETVGQIKQQCAMRIRCENPARARQQRSDRDQQTRSEPVDQRALKWREERLQQNKQRESHLHGRQHDAELRHQRLR